MFPFLRSELPKLANGEESTYSHHMRDAQFKIRTAG
jgi:type I restriction enzyme M protein